MQDLYNRRCKTPPLQGRVLARRATGKLTDKCGAFWHRISESRCYGGIASSILPHFGRCTPSCQQTSRSIDTVVICAATNPLGKVLASISHHCNKTSPINKHKTMAAEVDPGSCVCRAFFFPSLSVSQCLFCSIISCSKTQLRGTVRGIQATGLGGSTRFCSRRAMVAPRHTVLISAPTSRM